ncbi:MAG TPA: hypothetical protein VIV40_04095 [Kofleriaceae bacterium]
MIDIQIKSGGDPQTLAELIASTLHGHIVPDPESDLAAIGKLVREQQEHAEQRRPSRQQIETVNFAKIDDETDWSDV